MSDIKIARVTLKEITLLNQALRALAVDLGDDFLTDEDTLCEAVCGANAPCIALLAHAGGEPLGIALASRVFSTVRGGAGLYVSDLWVAKAQRGKGLARRLLALTAQEGVSLNAGHFLKLTVYHDNPQALAAYDQLGFIRQVDETNMILTGTGLAALKETS